MTVSTVKDKHWNEIIGLLFLLAFDHAESHLRTAVQRTRVSVFRIPVPEITNTIGN